MEKVLILGATGLLGIPLANYLSTQGHSVIRHGLKSNADIQGDLQNLVEVEEIVKKVSPDVIINLVALTDVDRCEEDPNLAYCINVKPLENLMIALRRRNKLKIIHISTDHVYDGAGPHKESDIVIRNTYAFSKYCAEHVALGIGGCVLRTNFVGKSEVAGRLSFSDWVLSNTKERNAIKLFTDVFFSPLSIYTLIQMIELVADNHQPGVFNLGSHEGMSKYDFARQLARTIGLNLGTAIPILSSEYAFKAHRPTDMRMDCTLFENIFGVKLPTLTEEIKLLGRDYV